MKRAENINMIIDLINDFVIYTMQGGTFRLWSIFSI